MEEIARIEEIEGEGCLELRGLWEEVFWEDSRAFTDYYFAEKAARNHAFAWKIGQEYISMLYLSPYPMMLRTGKKFVCREINYIVGVATKEKYRHRGYMDRLLKKALFFAGMKGQPFVFLMPADPKIYTPYQFTYIYDRKIYGIRGDRGGESIRKMQSREFRALSDCASSYLGEHYDVFIRRNDSYYRKMERELEVQNGGICLGYGKDGTAEGYFFYTEEEGKGEIPEAVLPEGEERYPIYDSGKKEPAIMARITDVGAMLSLMRAMTGEIAWSVLVRDPILPQNEGIWRCRMTPEEAFVEREEKCAGKESGAGKKCGAEGENGAPPACECLADIESLTAWAFGYRKEEECFRFPDAVDGEAVLCKLRKIRRLCRVFINEIV